MEKWLKDLHLHAGKVSGESRTCGSKVKYGSDLSATKACNSLNGKPGRNHNVEPYPCYFCGKWHIGKVMTIDELQAHGSGYL